MLTHKQNQRLTQTGLGTPGGELLRRYWWPAAVSTELESESVIGVRILGEDLALYRTESGKLGLVAELRHRRGGISGERREPRRFCIDEHAVAAAGEERGEPVQRLRNPGTRVAPNQRDRRKGLGGAHGSD